MAHDFGLDESYRDEFVECDGVWFTPPAGGRDPLEVDCDFADEIEVSIGGGSKTWTCPQCGKEHEESWALEDAIDPDEDRGDFDD